MPAITTPVELQAEGFQAAQFGVDDANWSVYLQTLLDEQGLIVLQRVGADAYATTDELLKNRIKRTERFLAAAELWLRRMNQVESDITMGGEDKKNQGYERYEYNYKTYARKASIELAALPTATAVATEATSLPAFGSVASSHFERAVL